MLMRYITGLVSQITGFFAQFPLFFPLNMIVLPLLAWLFGIKVKEAESNIKSYKSFQALFTRKLKPGLRPISKQAVVVSPCDGTLVACEDLAEQELLEVKKQRYRPQTLLNLEKAPKKGVVMSLYLAPYNYHRFHMPRTAIIRSLTHIPGPLYPVDTRFQALMPQVMLRNERVIVECETEKKRWYMVAVGALNVGKIEFPWMPDFKTNLSLAKPSKTTLKHELQQGDELGYFAMGSSIVLVLPDMQLADVQCAANNAVFVGDKLI